MCELAVLESAAGLDAAVLSALGLQAPATTDIRAYLLEVLSTWRALLIVDNCEHLLRDHRESCARRVGRCSERVGAGHQPGTAAPTSGEGDDVGAAGRGRRGRSAVHRPGDQLAPFLRARRRESFGGGRDLRTSGRAASCDRAGGGSNHRHDPCSRSHSGSTSGSDCWPSDPRTRVAGTGHCVDWSSGATTFWNLRPSCSSPTSRSSPGPLTFRPPATSARLDDELTALDLLAELVDKSLVTAAPRLPDQLPPAGDHAAVRRGAAHRR